MFDFFKSKKEKEAKIEEYYNDIIDESDSSDRYLNQDSDLLDLFGPAEKNKNKIMIVFVSDTANNLDELRFADYVYRAKDYDACIIIGNTSEKDNNIIKKYVDKNKLYSLPLIDGIKCINKEITKINGIDILGYSECSISQAESVIDFNSYPRADLLITYNNKFDDNTKTGLFGIKYYIYKNKVTYHVHGESLRQYKNTLYNDTKDIGIFEFEYISFPLENE